MIFICSLEKSGDGAITVIVLRQKFEINGKAFVINEVYGINNFAADSGESQEERLCSICMSEKVDTIILPCKHMCVCFDCSKDLRSKTNKCPICRGKIDSFLRLEKDKNAH